MKSWKFVLVLLGVSIAILAGFWGGTLLKRNHDIQAVPWPPNMNVDDWKVYTNKEFNFSFKYPADWYIKVYPTSSIHDTLLIEMSNYTFDRVGNRPKLKSHFKMGVAIYADEPLTGQSLDDWIASRGAYQPSQVVKKGVVQVAGQDSKEYAVEYYPGTIIHSFYLIIKNPDFENLVMSVSALPFDEPWMEEVFYLVASTMRVGPYSRPTISPPFPWPPDMNVNEWATYTNEDFHFSFKYPSDFDLKEYPGSLVKGADGVAISNYLLGTVQVKGQERENFFKMNFVIHATTPLKDDQTLDDWLKHGYIGAPRNQQQKPLQVDGRDAIEVAVEYFPGVIGHVVLLVIEDTEYGDLIMSISIPYKEPGMEEVSRLILTTLKIESNK